MNHPNLSPELNKMVETAEKANWLNIKELKKGDDLEVHTRNTIYIFTIIDPETGAVLVENNSEKHPIAIGTTGSILGTTLSGTGTMLKMGCISTGLKMDIWVEGYGELILSTTQKILLNGNEVHFSNN